MDLNIPAHILLFFIAGSRPFTPVVYDYIEQIQREVNKVQGHPSDLYPELFTPHIVNAIIGENEGLYDVFEEIYIQLISYANLHLLTFLLNYLAHVLNYSL